jgi:hypothetical protein
VRAFVVAVLALSEDPGPDNVGRYLDASRALDDSRGASGQAEGPARRTRLQEAPDYAA